MKTRLTTATTLTITLLLFAVPLFAATKQWSTPAHWSTIYQIVADGKGGCAVYGTGTGGYFLAWYCKKGQEIYTTQLTGSSAGIYACSKKSLAYNRQGTAHHEMIVVDTSGAETPVSENQVDFYYIGSSTHGVSVTHDKKGYFVPKRNMDTGKTYVTRYTYK
jgi:hypothetical protein